MKRRLLIAYLWSTLLKLLALDAKHTLTAENVKGSPQRR